MTVDFATESHLQRAMTVEKQREMDSKPYRELLGSLLYLARRTRPDISHAVCLLCRATQNPSVQHWNAAKRILRYLEDTKDFGIVIGRTKDEAETREGDELVAYCDADWAGDRNDQTSITGFAIFSYGEIISWGTRKKKYVVLSSTEA